jgi:CRISP-associated protein Cas1
MQLIIDTEGAHLKIKDGCFLVTLGETVRIISPTKITSIAIGDKASLTAAVVILAAEHDVPIIFNNSYGKPMARTHGKYFKNEATIRRKQVLFALETAATEWIIETFRLKLIGQTENIKFLKYHRPSIDGLADKYFLDSQNWLSEMWGHRISLLKECGNSLMGLEGTTARQYWQLIEEGLNNQTLFDNRTRMPAHDPFNCALNYGYGMLYNVVETAVLAAGLDPQLGFLHADDFYKPTFVYDMIEPFRPWVDRIVLEEALTGRMSNQYFDAIEGGFTLNRNGKNWLIPLFNDSMQEKSRFREKQLSRQGHINRFAGEFAVALKNFNNEAV